MSYLLIINKGRTREPGAYPLQQRGGILRRHVDQHALGYKQGGLFRVHPARRQLSSQLLVLIRQFAESKEGLSISKVTQMYHVNSRTTD